MGNAFEYAPDFVQQERGKMPIAQSCFLHKPAHDIKTISEYVNQRRDENEQLDFKREAWKHDESDEAVKDIAAFANSLGGDIIIGIDDVNNRASGWNPIPDDEAAKIIERVTNWMMTLLRPQDFAEVVRIRAIKTTQPNHLVIAVSIPASLGLVGGAKKGHSRYLGFPVREGTQTRWLGLEEIMQRASISTRGTYIKLKSLVDSFGSGSFIVIGFSSPVLVVAGDELKPLPVQGGIHCELDKLTPDVINVKMGG